jgi:hypothetical protein
MARDWGIFEGRGGYGTCRGDGYILPREGIGHGPRHLLLRQEVAQPHGVRQELPEHLSARHPSPAWLGRFPGGVTGPDDYWRFLRGGGNGIVEVPRDLERAMQMLHAHALCDHCLGRQFASLGYNIENKERGKSVKLSLTLQASVLAQLENAEGLRSLKVLAVNGFSREAADTIRHLKNRFQKRKLRRRPLPRRRLHRSERRKEK